MRALRMLRTFARMDGAMKVHVAEAMFLPIAIGLGFKTVGVARTQGLLRAWSGRRQGISAPDTIGRARRAQVIVKRATGIGGTCLVRSFALWAMLRRRGIETEIRVGMRKRDGRIEGHAWLEHQGRSLNETDSEIATYSALPMPATYDLWLRGSKARSVN